MNLQKGIQLLRAQKPLAVFKKVIAFNEKTLDPAQRVQVRLGLGSDFIVEGAPLHMDQDGNTVFVGLKDTVSYANTRSILGIEILNPTALLAFLTDDRYVPVPENNIPTRLALKRTLKEMAEGLRTAYAIELIVADLIDKFDTSVAKYQFDVLLHALSDALQVIVNDLLGKDALQTIKKIGIVQSQGELLVEKNGDEISIQLDLNRKLNKDLKKQLQQRLEQCL